MTQAEVDISQVMAMLQRVLSRSRDVSGALIKILGENDPQNPMTVIGGINAAFVTKGVSIGRAWESLSLKYARWKAKKFPGKPMLVRTGLMYYSVTTPGSTGNVRMVQPTKLIWGTLVPYAVYHQSDQPRTRMPYRPFMSITQKQSDLWGLMISDYIQGVS